MPAQSPHRITLTLPPDLHAILKRAAASYGRPVATIAISMLTNGQAKLGQLVDEADRMKELEAAFVRTCTELPSLSLSSSTKPAQQPPRPAQRALVNDPSLNDDREAVLSPEPAEGRIPHSDLTAARHRLLAAIRRGAGPAPEVTVPG